jgi:hypothetical protein
MRKKIQKLRWTVDMTEYRLSGETKTYPRTGNYIFYHEGYLPIISFRIRGGRIDLHRSITKIEWSGEEG